MTFKILYGLTYNSMNWSNLCICYTFEEWNFVYCTVFSRISRKCRNFCDLRAYFTKWEISCNIVWLSYQNPKYRVISCVSKKSISLRGGIDALSSNQASGRFNQWEINFHPVCLCTALTGRVWGGDGDAAAEINDLQCWISGQWRGAFSNISLQSDLRFWQS